MIDEGALERACHGALHPLLEAGPGRFAGGDPGRRTWRSTIAARGLSFMALERGVAELEALVAFQREDGLLPVAPGSASPAVPLAATMLRRIYFTALGQQRHLGARLARMIPLLERYHELLFGGSGSHLHLSDPGDELLLPPGDAGDEGAGRLIDVGFNAILVQAESDLADVSIHCGCQTTQGIMVRRTKRAQALQRKLYHEDQQIFCCRRRQRWVTPPTAAGLLPLFAGIPRPDQAEALVARYLTPGQGFWRGLPLSTVQPGDPGYRPDGIGRGAISPVVNWLVCFGLYRYGFDELAQELARATQTLLLEQGPWEAFHAESGQGLGRPADEVTASIGLCLVRAPHQVQGIAHF